MTLMNHNYDQMAQQFYGSSGMHILEVTKSSLIGLTQQEGNHAWY